MIVRGQKYGFSRKIQCKFNRKVKNEKQNKTKKPSKQKINKNIQKLRKILTLLGNGMKDYCTHKRSWIDFETRRSEKIANIIFFVMPRIA